MEYLRGGTADLLLLLLWHEGVLQGWDARMRAGVPCRAAGGARTGRGAAHGSGRVIGVPWRVAVPGRGMEYLREGDRSTMGRVGVPNKGRL